MRDVERRRQRDHERYLRQRDERLERQRGILSGEPRNHPQKGEKSLFARLRNYERREYKPTTGAGGDT